MSRARLEAGRQGRRGSTGTQPGDDGGLGHADVAVTESGQI